MIQKGTEQSIIFYPICTTNATSEKEFCCLVLLFVAKLKQKLTISEMLTLENFLPHAGCPRDLGTKSSTSSCCAFSGNYHVI